MHAVYLRGATWPASRALKALAREGFEVSAVNGASEALDRLRGGRSNLMILERAGPGDEELTLLRLIRDSPLTRRLPVLLVCAGRSSEERVEALRLGADDCLSPPVHADELAARAAALARRSRWSGPPASDWEVDGVQVSLGGRYVAFGGRRVPLRRREYELLHCLLSYPGRALSREQLLETVWQVSAPIATRVVDVTVSNLRRKLGPAGTRIVTWKGLGYGFDASEAAFARRPRLLLAPTPWLRSDGRPP